MKNLSAIGKLCLLIFLATLTVQNYLLQRQVVGLTRNQIELAKAVQMNADSICKLANASKINSEQILLMAQRRAAR